MSDTLQTDWDWLLKVMKMTEDRVLDGQRIRLRRPVGWSKTADIRRTMEAGVCGMVANILSTAEIIEPEEADGVP